jgi:hypothetical protein
MSVSLCRRLLRRRSPFLSRDSIFTISKLPGLFSPSSVTVQYDPESGSSLMSGTLPLRVTMKYGVPSAASTRTIPW